MLLQLLLKHLHAQRTRERNEVAGFARNEDFCLLATPCRSAFKLQPIRTS